MVCRSGVSQNKGKGRNSRRWMAPSPLGFQGIKKEPLCKLTLIPQLGSNNRHPNFIEVPSGASLATVLC